MKLQSDLLKRKDIKIPELNLEDTDRIKVKSVEDMAKILVSNVIEESKSQVSSPRSDGMKSSQKNSNNEFFFEPLSGRNLSVKKQPFGFCNAFLCYFYYSFLAAI